MSATCPHCGKPVPPSALGGLCPECMLNVGASAPTGEIEPGGTVPAGPPPPPPPAPEDLAAHFPHLEIMECLGRGGMGAVYKARQPKLDRLVALKILLPRPGATGMDAGFTERFEREARALAQLNHPNIVGVHDFGEAGGYHYLVMEFVDGLNLRQTIQARKLRPEGALAIVPHICEALQYAHEQGVIHRDIKPENILLAGGEVKIADFGIAKILRQQPGQEALTRERDVMGTPHYMAPEQVEQPLKVDHRADIYSLGVVFYEMLTGELPLGIFAPPSRKVNVDVRLDEVVLHTLEKEPERRYQHASEVKTDIQTILTSGAVPTSGAPAVVDPVLEKRTNLLIFGLVLCVIGVPFGLGLRLPFVTGLALAGILVAILKLSGRLQISSPLFGDPYPGLRAALPHTPREFSPAAMILLAFGCACCCCGIAFGLAIEHALFTPVLVVLGIAGTAAIVPAMALGRQVLTGPRQEARRAPRERPASRKPSRGPLYWIGTLLLAWFGLLFLVAILGVLVSIALPAFQRERSRQAGEATRRQAEAMAQVLEFPVDNDVGDPPDWGPVYEVTLDHELSCLDLDTGDTLTAPDFLDSDTEPGLEEIRARSQETGIDLFPNMNPPGFLTGLDLVAIPVSSKIWSDLSAALPRHLQDVVPEQMAVLATEPHRPATYAFRTREGGEGLLQITNVDLTSGQSSITLRYKLTGPRATRVAGVTGKKAAQRAAHAELQMLENTLDLYTLDVGRYPEELEDLLRDDGRGGWRGPYVRDMPVDAWGTAYQYSVENRRPALISLGPDKVLGTDDDISNREEVAGGLSVARNGAADYRVIQDAIDAAPHGTTITIGPGLYDEMLIIDRPLTLQGAGWDRTVIGPLEPWTGASPEAMQGLERRMHAAETDAERNRLRDEFAQMHMRPLVEIRHAEGVRFQGLGLKRPGVGQEGKLLPLPVINLNASVATIADCAVVASPGHGITLENGSHATITNTLVAAAWNTGVVVGPGTSAEIVDCDIRNCHYAGVVLKRDAGRVEISRCRVSGAAWHGIRYDDVSPFIRGNLIFNNARSGIYASGNTAAQVSGNVFHGNEMNGMSCWYGSHDVVMRNTFHGNLREGLAVLGAATPETTYNVFSEHPVAFQQGPIRGDAAGYPGEPIVEWNLFWRNETDWARVPAGAAEGEEAWEPKPVRIGPERHSLFADPLYADAANEDFRFRGGSPATAADLGAQDPLSPRSPWPLQPEERAIMPDGATRDSRKWKRVVASADTEGGDVFSIASEDVVTAALESDTASGTFSVRVTLTEEAASRLRLLTQARLGEALPIVVHGDVVSEPWVQSIIHGPDLKISGSSEEEARRILAGLTTSPD